MLYPNKNKNKQAQREIPSGLINKYYSLVLDELSAVISFSERTLVIVLSVIIATIVSASVVASVITITSVSVIVVISSSGLEDGMFLLNSVIYLE